MTALARQHLPWCRWLALSQDFPRIWRHKTCLHKLCSDPSAHRPHRNAAEQSQLQKVPFLSKILSFNTSLQACRAYSSFPVRSLRLNTPLQVLGSCSSSSQDAPLPTRWGESMAAPTAEAFWRFHICQTEQLKPRKERNGKAVPAQRWVLGMAVSPRSPSRPRSETWACSAACSAALTATAAGERNCPALRHSCLSRQRSPGAASPGQLFQWGAQQLTFC